MKVKLCSWNVNGLRACLKKGFDIWFESSNYDIIGLQETKSRKDQLPAAWQEPDGYYAYYGESKKAGYSGVALYSSKKLEEPKVTIGLGLAKYDDEGRAIIAEYKKFIVITAYFPNGSRDHSRVPYKLSFSKYLVKKALKLKEETGKEIIICGDVNTSHQEIDLANPKANKNSTGFLPIEREWIDQFIAQGFIDTFRVRHPDEPGHYTWWTYRGNCRERNIGWRLDYFFVSKNLNKSISKSVIHPEVMGSDHCPVSISLDL